MYRTRIDGVSVIREYTSTYIARGTGAALSSYRTRDETYSIDFGVMRILVFIRKVKTANIFVPLSTVAS